MFFEGKLIHTITWWRHNPGGGLYDPEWDDPVHVAARWEDRQERRADTEGVEFVSRALVMADREFSPGDRLAFGEYDSQPDAEGVESYIIRAKESIPSVFGEITERSYWL